MTKFSNSERLRQRLPGGARGGPEGVSGVAVPGGGEQRPPGHARAERGRRRAPSPGRQRRRQRRGTAPPHTASGPLLGLLDRARSACSPPPRPAAPCPAGGDGSRTPGRSGAGPVLPRSARRAVPPGMLSPRARRAAAGRRRTAGLAPRGSQGKKKKILPGGLGKERHLQRLQRRARLGGLNPARGAKLAPGPRLGLLCRCQKVNSARLPGHCAPRCRPAAHGEGGGRRPTASHSPWPFTLWRAAGAPRQLHRAPRSRPPHSSCAPAARPPRPALPAPAPPRAPTAQSPGASLASRRTPAPGFAEEGARPRPRGAGPAPVPPHRGRRLGRAGASAGCGALPGLRAHSGVHVYVYVLLRIAVVAAVTCVRCSVLGDLVPCSPCWASPPLSTVAASLFGFTVRATNQAEVSGGTKSLVGAGSVPLHDGAALAGDANYRLITTRTVPALGRTENRFSGNTVPASPGARGLRLCGNTALPPTNGSLGSQMLLVVQAVARLLPKCMAKSRCSGAGSNPILKRPQMLAPATASLGRVGRVCKHISLPGDTSPLSQCSRGEVCRSRAQPLRPALGARGQVYPCKALTELGA